MYTYKWEEAQKVITSGNIYLWIGSKWCIDCVNMLPIIERIESRCIQENLDIRFIKVDADEAKLFRQPDPKYNVDYVPAHVFMKNDKVILTLYEMQQEEVIYQEILKLIKMK